MKNATLIAVCLACSVASLFVLAEGAAVPAGHTYTVIINNTCFYDIRVAIHYRHPASGWITEGWWEVPGRSELPTGLAASDHRFYMHGYAPSARRQWPPENSRKQYNRYPVLMDSFTLEEGEGAEGAETQPFSLKEVSPGSAGLKARFDC